MFSGVIHANDAVKISTKGGFSISSGDYNFQLGGRIMYDYNKAELNGVTDEDTFEIRRSRIYIKGSVAKNWEFKSQFNLNDNGGNDVEDLYLRYTGWGKQFVITVGNQKMPFMLETKISSKDISILERSAITERYLIGRKKGIVLAGQPYTNHIYIIGAYLEDKTNKNENDAEIGFGIRYAFVPFKTDNSLTHIGLSYRDFDRPGNQINALGLELATVYGAFHAQAEWVNAEENDTDVDGYYLQVGYVLTGEVRPYRTGVFKRILPRNNFGAWEIVTRYEDGDGKYSDIELGTTDATAYTIGLNWYAHKNVRFGINYTEGDSEVNNDEGYELRLRAQLTF